MEPTTYRSESRANTNWVTRLVIKDIQFDRRNHDSGESKLIGEVGIKVASIGNIPLKLTHYYYDFLYS